MFRPHVLILDTRIFLNIEEVMCTKIHSFQQDRYLSNWHNALVILKECCESSFFFPETWDKIAIEMWCQQYVYKPTRFTKFL